MERYQTIQEYEAYRATLAAALDAQADATEQLVWALAAEEDAKHMLYLWSATKVGMTAKDLREIDERVGLRAALIRLGKAESELKSVRELTRWIA